MRNIIEGHLYVLENFENKKTEGQRLQFIQKETRKDAASMSASGTDPGELITINDGTTNEEVLEMLIDRMKYLQAKFPCRENSIVITKLEESLMWLNKRTADRVARKVEGKHLV